jgi:hypothetical protein
MVDFLKCKTCLEYNYKQSDNKLCKECIINNYNKSLEIENKILKENKQNE